MKDNETEGMKDSHEPERDGKPRDKEMTKEHARIHEEARRRFVEIMSKERDEREQSREDRRFYSVAGAQWEGALGEQFENKPRLEVNKVSLSIIKIFSSFRKNPITAKFVSRDGSDADELAEVCAGLYLSLIHI